MNNLKEIAISILEKNNFNIEVEDCGVVAATEKSKYVYRTGATSLGENFENFPFPNKGIGRNGEDLVQQNLVFLNKDGDKIAECKCSNLKYYSQADFEHRSLYEIDGNKDEAVFAVISVLNINEKHSSSNIIFLSRPYTIEEINKIRRDFFSKKKKEVEEANLKAKLKTISTVWDFN